VTDDAYGATLAKRELARRLMQLRVRAGHTANHVCDMLNWGRGKVGRFEANQWKRPEMSDIRDLLRIYGADEAEQEELTELAIRARARPWWREYTDVYDNEFPGYENDASRIRTFLPLVLPGLLQTPDYAEALMQTAARPPSWRRRALEARQRRQEILDRSEPPPPQVLAVITEAALCYNWGPRADRRAQIEYLVELSKRPNIKLRIQRFVDGPPHAMYSAVSIFDFPGGEPSVVFTESDYAIQEVDDAEQVKSYVDAFNRAADAALEPADTTGYLIHLAEELE
jgi:hypothetical protein